MRPVRLVVVTVGCLLAVLGLGGAALAQVAPVANCTNGSSFAPGQTVVVRVSGALPNDTATLLLNGGAIGGPVSTGTGTFTISGQVPSNTVAGPYEVTVRFADGGGGPNPLVACDITVTGAAASTPSPTPVPTSTAPVVTVPVTTFPVFIPISVSQQQQQQQQQQGGGGGGGAPAARPQRQGDPASGGQQQQQQQQSGGGITLPRTGADIVRSAEWGSGLLAFGLLLVLWARRRRRKARARAFGELPPIDAVVVEPEHPWLPGTPHPSEFLTEADGVPPVYLPVTAQLALPPAPETDTDVLTPSF